MSKKSIEISGYSVTQLDKTIYEAENLSQGLDFYLEADDPEEIKVFVFDSLNPTKGENDHCLGVFYASSLEEAVTDCMTFTKETLKGHEWFKN